MKLMIDSDKLSREMAKRGIGIQDLAREAKVSTTLVSKSATASKPVTLRSVGRLALALSIDIDDLLLTNSH